jgi:hypothetical protein
VPLKCFLVQVEQTVNGKHYRQQNRIFSAETAINVMNTMMRMDQALYRQSGAILPSRQWRSEEVEF